MKYTYNVINRLQLSRTIVTKITLVPISQVVSNDIFYNIFRWKTTETK